MISFGSDNHAGVHPAVLEAIAAANSGFTPAYGADPWTEILRGALKDQFGPHAIGYPVFNGTGANVIALACGLKRYEAVIAAEKSHIDVDEGGAPERVGGMKLLTIATRDQKLSSWASAPYARQAHPREEHLIPLMVVAGAAGADRGTVGFSGAFAHTRISAFHYG